jgi:hypothetical protein
MNYDVRNLFTRLIGMQKQVENLDENIQEIRIQIHNTLWDLAEKIRMDTDNIKKKV